MNAGSMCNRMVRKLLDGISNLESQVDNVLGHTKNLSERMSMLRDLFGRVRRVD